MAKQNTEIRTLEDLPAILNAEHIAQVMGLSRPVVYDLMGSEGFPTIKIGKRKLVSKTAFEEWLNKSAGV